MRAGVTSLLRYCSDNGLTALLSEYSKDNPYSSDKIGFKSTIPCKWVCSHGHIEYETPYNRVRRGYCKMCGRDCAGSLGQRYPELAKYWSPENEKSAFAVSPRSSVPHYWCCEHGHKWSRTIAQQLAASSPCPFCKSEGNSLFTRKPELSDEWDYERNHIAPENVSYMSNTAFYWICPEGHSFTATPAERMRRNKGCPVCKSLLKKRPDIAYEWHPTKNTFGPESVTPMSHKEAWFICQNCHREYICEIAARVRRKGPNCPHCR